jgi:CRP-like cAMP-binding protein
VIQDGTFTIYNDEGQELARVGKGSCFGELALLRKARDLPGPVPSAAGLRAGGRGPAADCRASAGSASHAACQHGCK